jgi:unsaturated chondroitin disaccharide hydrolase
VRLVALAAVAAATGCGPAATGVPQRLISYDVRVARGETAQLTSSGATLPIAAGVHRVEVASGPDAVLVGVDGRLAGRFATVPELRDGRQGDSRLATGSGLADRLAHRLATLHALAPAGAEVMGTDREGRLQLSTDWMAGFWPGALWLAADRHPRPFGAWALAATRRLSGGEAANTHDLGFIYGHSALLGWRRRCSRPGRPPRGDATCRALAHSALRAAATLAGMLHRSRSGLLPTTEARCGDCAPGEREAIVDSLENLPLIVWGGRHAHRPQWRRLAARAAHAVVRVLVRADGSTAQAVRFDARTGALGAIHSHQGLSAASTWARGEAWALDGTATLAAELHDAPLHAAAERIAAFLHSRLDAGGLPRWDFAATSGPTDASAAAVTAAGLARLAALDLRHGRTADAARHRTLAVALLARIGDIVPATPPIGRFAGQVYTYGGSTLDEDAELMLGTDYVLQAVELLSRRSAAAAR